jgi:cholesterol transport system auxiliary component
MRGKKILFSLVGVSFLLVSCSVFAPIKADPANTYVLSRTPAPQVKKTSRALTLLVNYPQTSAVYNTTQMAYSTQPFKVAYFSKNQWADLPAQMLQPLMVQTLQSTHYFRQIISPGVLGQYNYVLNTELIELLHVFTQNSSYIRVVLKAQVVDTANNRVIKTKTFSVDEPAVPAPYGGVVAANAAVARLLGQVAQFTVQAV